MAVTITAGQRDALYDRILDRLSGIDDILLAVGSEDFATADRLAREYCDELRLVVDDLGWGTRAGSVVVELGAPPDLLRRLFGRFRAAAASEREAQEKGWEEARALDRRNRLIEQACSSVLDTLEHGS